LPLQNKKIKTSGIEFTGFCRKIRVVFYRFCQSREKVYYFVNREKYFDEIKEIGYEPIPKGLLLKVVVEANYLPEFVCLKKEFEKIIKEKDIKVLYIGR